MCDKLIKTAGTKEKRKEVLFMEMHKKLKFTEKLSYGIADLPEAANSIIAAFLTMFYTDNIGLAAAAVGTMFFISKLFDGISDILAGILIDKTRTKWGNETYHLPASSSQTVRTLRSSKSCIACFWVMALFTLIA